MLEELSHLSETALRETFRWNLPGHFNIGVDCSDAQPPERLAMIHIDADGALEHVRYRDLARDSNRLANALASMGVEPGDRVCVSLPQHPRLAISHLAIYKLGAIAVPMTTLFGPDAYRVRLRGSGARIMLTDGASRAKVEPLRGDLPELGRIVDLESEWDGLLDAASERFTPADTSLDDPALLIYTSGTTGDPKGALHGHQVLLGHLPGFELSHNFYGQPGDRFWTPADWSWIGGLYDAVFPTLHHGSTIVSYASRGGFDPERAIDVMRRHQVRNTFLPPTALKLMRLAWDASKTDDLQLRTVMSGGEPLGAETLAWGQEAFGLTINEIYGQTEANYIVGNCSALYPVVPDSMGKSYVGHEVTVVDEIGNQTAELGQIAVKKGDPVMFLRYWNNDAATVSRFIGDWMLTGDMARLDMDGYFWFEGRNDDLINSAGYRIGPTEIEACIMRHPSVARAAVIGVPDAVRGQAISAFVVLRPGLAGDEALQAEIQQLVRSGLAAYQYPRHIQFVHDLPMTTTGKVRRTELREQGRSENEARQHGSAQEEKDLATGR